MATKHFLGGRILLGTEYAGYKIGIFEAGTTTPKTTYTDSALTAGNENQHPVTLDANGAAQIWFDGNAKAIFYTPATVTVYTDDNVNLTDASSSSGDANLSLNSSFEDDTDSDGIPDNWTRTLYTSGTFSLDSTNQFNGSKSVKFTSVGTGGGYITSTDTFAVGPSISYTVGFALKSSDAGVRNVVEVLWYQDDGTASSTASTTLYDDSTTNPTSWAEKWYQTSSPSDAAFAKLRLTGCHSSDATTGSTWFDDIKFTRFAVKNAPNTFTNTNTFSGGTGAVVMSSSSINEAKGSDIADSATPAIGAATGNFIDLNGTTTITGFDTVQAGTRRLVRFMGARTLTYNATSLILPGAASITTAIGDVAEFISLGSGNWLCTQYVRANGVGLTQGLVKLASDSGTSSAINIVMTSYTSYKHKRLVFSLTPANDAVTLWFRTSTDGGSNYDNGASDYTQGSIEVVNGTRTDHAAGALSRIELASNQSVAATARVSGFIDMWDTTNTALFFRCSWMVSGMDTASENVSSSIGSGNREAAGDVDAVRLLTSVGGNMTYTWELYGWN